jgi:hypothetical protein
MAPAELMQVSERFEGFQRLSGFIDFDRALCGGRAVRQAKTILTLICSSDRHPAGTKHEVRGKNRMHEPSGKVILAGHATRPWMGRTTRLLIPGVGLAAILGPHALVP